MDRCVPSKYWDALKSQVILGVGTLPSRHNTVWMRVSCPLPNITRHETTAAVLVPPPKPISMLLL
ncbi:hypothetical protein H2248_005514 [Termitomyces sp. 'cryptogamus']|nr:hypothetical protein H2248_005514 [Termitomyces sp. 'cryptogamus']